ncbi:hypothetical protein Vqi01_53950 [Micromonospora qiuiae]|uniref:Uncharacterized protein n=1 Tax=Micromonospora qiuiae TaxID=502268 RepID=A0ABQ4JHZ9_9ACTN|nr:hypothetical protein Vqi01_53950 [Micromonospora qiuiae]
MCVQQPGGDPGLLRHGPAGEPARPVSADHALKRSEELLSGFRDGDSAWHARSLGAGRDGAVARMSVCSFWFERMLIPGA